ncbi:MAG: DUF1592 domain-containing protein [Lentisphaerales bacterium]|nr:DUF1592 domain-containing protein [Lentisphaerales bacterium]
MNKCLILLGFLAFSFPSLAQNKPTSNSLPSLSKAREVGLSKSNFLTPKESIKIKSNLIPTANLADFSKHISPILEKNCLDCHGPKKAKGKFRVDQLDPNLLKGKDIAKWLEVYEVLSNSEMPPDDEPDYYLNDKQRNQFIDWLGEEMGKAYQVRRNEKAHTSFRRMAKYEYNYALQDLLGLPYNFVELLPTENTSKDGFKNSSELLQMSAMQFESYRQIGINALQKAVVIGTRPEEVTFVLDMNKEMARLTQKATDATQKNNKIQNEITELNKKIKEISASIKSTEKKIGDKEKEAKTSKQQKDLRAQLNKESKALKKLQSDLTGKQKALKKNKGPQFFALNNSNSQRKMHLSNTKSSKGIHWSVDKLQPTQGATGGKIPPVAQTRLVMNQNEKLTLNLGNKIPDEGTLRVRLRVGRTTLKPNEFTSLRLSISAHTSNNANFQAVISKEDIPITATINKPQFIEFLVPLSEIPRNPLRHEGGSKTMSKDSRMTNEFLTIQNIANSNGGKDPLRLHIDYIEIYGPYFKQWPPKSHTAIFKNSNHKKDETKYSSEILKRFMGKAWRRPVTAFEIEPYVQLFQNYRPQFDTFEEAMVEVLATVLASPDFLYVAEKAETKGKNEISHMEMAMRLAVFLWSSIPDNELLKLAHQGKLKVPKVLAAQTKRMLAHPKAERFAQNFVNQWLGLDKINSVDIDKKLFRQYNEDFKKDLLNEPIEFFKYVLKSNSSIIDFIHSDYVVVNEILARHYRLRDVHGPHFRKVPVQENMNRGGILTNAAIHTMNSTGKDSHPLKRGIWLLEHILHDPPPPPPPNVPEVDLTDPRILKMTQKERMADHRDNAACRSCHAKIDPWGVAFENHDALGAFRTQINKKPVDATSVLFNKQKLDGMLGMKRYLLTDRQDQFTRAMVHKMTTYALGRPLSFSDRSDVDAIAAKLRKNGDRLGNLVHLIVSSSIFHSK